MSSPPEVVSFDQFDDLLAAARNGDKEAQGRLLDKCRDFLLLHARRRLAQSRCRNGRESDVVQEALLKAVKEIHTFQGCTPEQLEAWLRTILDHTVANLARRCRAGKRDVNREVSVQGELPGIAAPAADEVVARREHGRLVREAVRLLPPEWAEVVQLRHYDQLPWEEVGRRMGRSTEAVRQLNRRALQELGERLKGKC